MKKIFYEKRGRRYVPVSEYDDDLISALPKGTHLIQCYPGGSSRKYNIDPAYAPLIAAGQVAQNAICDALRKASDMRPSRAPITKGQQQAWERLVEEFGEEARMLTWPSARDASEEAVKAMIAEAEKLLTNPAVKKAWDHFQLIVKLTEEHKSEDSLY